MSSLPAQARAGWHFRKPSVIPGFRLTFGFSVAYLTLIILIPLAALVLRSSDVGLAGFWRIVTDERTLKALETSFGTAFIAALVNVVFGVILAWVLVRYRFAGRRFVDAIVDIPLRCRLPLQAFRWPRSMRRMAGSAACSALMASASPLRVWASSLRSSSSDCPSWCAPCSRSSRKSAARWRRRRQRLALPVSRRSGGCFCLACNRPLLPALRSPFARGIGEYGSVIFIAGNTPYKSESCATSHRHQA